MRKLQCFKVVKIFDHMLFLAVSQFDNISRRKLIWIVSYGLVNHLGCYAIQFSNISIKDNLRIPDDNDFTLCFYKCSQIIIHRHVCTALHPLETILL